MEAWLDEGFGELMGKLEAEALLDDTLIVFLIDNGWANGFVSKGSPFEKGLRTPFVFSWRGHIEPGRHSTELASYLDIMPTILDYANIDRPPDLPGKSLRPLIEGRAEPRRTELMGAVYPAFAREGSNAGQEALAIYLRTKRLKYVYWLQDLEPAQNDQRLRIKHFFVEFPERKRGDEDLYDLDLDPHERDNLVNDPTYEVVRENLKSELLAWWESQKI